MAYIYKKIIEGKTYYYLRVSKRVGEKVIAKDIAYLGSDASKIEKELSKISSVYKKDIRKAYSNIQKFIQSEYYLNKAKKLKLREDNYISRLLLEEVEAARLHFNERFLKLDKKTIKEAYKNFLIDFAFNTTSLEGNTITLNEAAKLLRENLTPKNRTLTEIYDLQNTEKVFFEILKSGKKIGHEFVIDIHDKLMENIDSRRGYRTYDIRVFKSHFEATPHTYIKTDMDILIKWVENNKKKLHPLVLASAFHQKFEKIHPFSDGNGRTGRMLMSYILLKNSYPPAIIRKMRRSEYLDALSEADKLGIKEISPKNYKRLSEYVAEELITSYWNNFLV